MQYNCPHLTKEDGSPTKKERQRVQGTEAEKGTELFQEGDVINNDDDDDESEEQADPWDDYVTETYYGFGFYMNGETLDRNNKEVVVEDLQGKDKHAFNHNQKRRLNPEWILLDNCSTVHVFYNSRFLTNIRESNRDLHLYTNAGMSIIHQVGDLLAFGPVWYQPDGIANMLSFNGLTNTPEYKIEYCNWVKDAFLVTNPKGELHKFVPSSSKGLYYWDMGPMNKTNRGSCLLEIATIKENENKFTQEDIA